MKTSLTFAGGRELEAALHELTSVQTRRNAAKRALVPEAEALRDEARRRAPVNEGRLREAIVVNTKQPTRRSDNYWGVTVWVDVNAFPYRPLKSLVAYAGRRGMRGEKRDFQVGSIPYVYGYIQEFGSRFMAAHPWFRPAWATVSDGILDRIRAALWAQIKAAAERQARKTARLGK